MTVQNIFIIIAILIAFGLYRFLSGKARYYTAMTKKIDKSTLGADKRIELSQDLLALIVNLIEIETNMVLKSYKLLNTRYAWLTLDDDIKTVSNAVYNGIKKEFIVDSSLIFSSEYIMNFILNQSTLILLYHIRDYNNSIPVQKEED